VKKILSHLRPRFFVNFSNISIVLDFKIVSFVFKPELEIIESSFSLLEESMSSLLGFSIIL